MKEQKNKTRPLVIGPEEVSDIEFPPGIRLLGEDDYDAYMEGENRNWRDRYVRGGDFKTFDGLTLRYYLAAHDQDHRARACIVMIHGYCGFWCKFHEMAEYYWREGYDVFFLEHRGHGYSARQVQEDDLVHVRDYEDYVKDLRVFMEEIVKPQTEGLKKVLFAHSMGGAVGSLYLETYPGDFDGAILSSPMLAVRTNGIPPFIIPLMRAKIALLRQEKVPFHGARPWTGEPAFETSSAMSLNRYMYIFKKRQEDSHYQTNRMSSGWAAASFRATAKVLKEAGRIQIPILLFSAGNDALVDNEGHAVFADRTANTEWVFYEGAKHELFNASDRIRWNYYARIFRFLKELTD